MYIWAASVRSTVPRSNAAYETVAVRHNGHLLHRYKSGQSHLATRTAALAAPYEVRG